MNLESLGVNDSIDGMSSIEGVRSNCATGEPSNFASTEIFSNALTSSGHSNEEISLNTPYRRPPYTSIKSGDSIEEPLISTPSQSTSVATIIQEEFRREFSNASSSQGTSERSVGGGVSAEEPLISTPSQSTSVATIIQGEFQRELTNVASSQSTSDGSVRDGDSSSEYPISTPSHSPSDTSFIYDSSAYDESTNDAVESGHRSKEPPGSKYICTSRPLPIGFQPSRSRSDNGMNSEVNHPSFIAEGPSTNWSSPEHFRDEVSSKSSSPLSKSDGFNNFLDEAFVICSEESYHLDYSNPLEFDRFLQTSEVLLPQQCPSAGEDCIVEMESIRYPNVENQTSILSQPECLTREGPSTPTIAKSSNIPDGSFIVHSPYVEFADNEMDDLEGVETNRESRPDAHAMQNETRSSSVTGSRADFSRSINLDRVPMSRKRDRSSLKRSCSSRYRTSTYKSVGLDNILVRSDVISSPESQGSENETEERTAFNAHQGARSDPSLSLLHKQRSSSARSLRAHSSRSKGGEQLQNSRERERNSEERSRSRNPCISFMDDVIEEHSGDEHDNTFEDRLENSRSSQRNLPISDSLSPVNSDIDFEADVHQTAIADVSTLSEIETPRSQITKGYKSRSIRISNDSSSSRDEGPSQLFQEVSSPDGSPRAVFRPCPWSPSILTWSTPTRSWYGDEPFPEHFPTTSSNSSRDQDPQEDLLSFSFEDQPQLSDPNRQPSDFFVLSPQRSSDQQNPLALFDEQSPLRFTINEESYVSLNESPQRSFYEESRHRPRPISSIGEPEPQFANQQYVSLDTPPQQSRYQPSPLSSDGEHHIRISLNQRLSASLNTSQHSSERESRQQMISLSSIQEPYLRVFKNRRYSASSGTPPQRSSEQESMHQLSPLSSIEEQPLRVTSNRQYSDSFNATPEHSNSFTTRNRRSSLAFEPPPQKISNQQSCLALGASPQNSHSSTAMHNQNPASMYEEQQPQESFNQPSVSSQHSDQRDLITPDRSPLRPSKKVALTEHVPFSEIPLQNEKVKNTLANRSKRACTVNRDAVDQRPKNTDRKAKTRKRLGYRNTTGK